MFDIKKLLAMVVVCGPAAGVAAHDYPTMDRVDQVLTCMKKNGGQNIDNMWRCSCEIDVIAQQLSLEDFNTARTFEIYKNMPGEKGGMFRESEDGAAAVDKLEAARKDAAKRCFVGATRQTVVPTESGMPTQPAKKDQ
jgi:Holliday junction resolvase-like predicted endonuclease